jgi:arsenate reductase (glutaredoxin)
LLDEKGIRYRDYVKDPPSASVPATCSAPRNSAVRELGLTGDEPDAQLIAAMAKHATLFQRPIGVEGNRAVVGRPPELLLELAGESQAR